MSSIYLAARFGRMAELQGYKRDLEARGHTVTSRWMLGGHDAATDSRAETDQAFAVKCANEDLDDIAEASVLICFTEPPQAGVGRNRGGRHVEFGYALALGTIGIVIVGPVENVPMRNQREDGLPVMGHEISFGGSIGLALTRRAPTEFWDGLQTGKRLLVTAELSPEDKGFKVVREKGYLIGLTETRKLVVTRMVVEGEVFDGDE